MRNSVPTRDHEFVEYVPGGGLSVEKGGRFHEIGFGHKDARNDIFITHSGVGLFPKVVEFHEKDAI